MFDLIIRGGDVVTPEGVARCDVAVAGETIAAIATPGSLPADSAKQLIDATGRIVMPGGIRSARASPSPRKGRTVEHSGALHFEIP